MPITSKPATELPELGATGDPNVDKKPRRFSTDANRLGILGKAWLTTWVPLWRARRNEKGVRADYVHAVFLKPVWIRAGGGVLSFLGTAELIGRIVW